MLRRIPVLILFTLFAACAWAQPANDDCTDAATLCAGQVLSGDNTGSLGATGFCPATGAVLWYKFTSNSLGGDATFSISSLNCAIGAGFDDELTMVVLSGNGACTFPSFSALTACVSSDVDFSLTASALMPNTEYWLLIAGAQNGGATSPANCDFELEMTGSGVDIVDVDFDAGPGFEIQSGETVQLQATGPGPNWNWSPLVGLSGNNIPDPFSSPNSTISYFLEEEINGCIYSDTAVVEVVLLIDPPNTFTPNGDGFNDTWEIVGINAYPNADVVIFDRWGQKVFSTNGYDEEWNGTRNGTALATGTYYYYIRLNRLEGQVPPITGSITILK